MPAPKCDASMLETRVYFCMSGGVTVLHVFPPSRVSEILPSSEPAHRTLGSSGDSAITNMTA